MARSGIFKGNYFLAGVGIGSVIGILFAPKSGKGTREYLGKKINEGSEFARRQAQELGVRAEDMVEYTKETVLQTKNQMAAAIDVGLETYSREKAKAHVS